MLIANLTLCVFLCFLMSTHMHFFILLSNSSSHNFPTLFASLQMHGKHGRIPSVKKENQVPLSGLHLHGNVVSLLKQMKKKLLMLSKLY